MRPKTLALVTIGQSPRVDVTPDILPFVGEAHVIEEGALDELSAPEIAELAPRDGEGVLVSRLRDGGHAVLSEERLQPLVEAAVARAVTRGADAVLIICTGSIPGIEAAVPVYMAESLAHGAMAALVGQTPLTVVAPEPEQAAGIGGRWSKRLGREVRVVTCDPYTAATADFAALGLQLADAPPAWVFLDCIGYSEAMADAMRQHLDTPVFTARALAARLIVAAL